MAEAKPATPSELWEILFGEEQQIPWTDFSKKLQRDFRIKYSKLRGFKRYLTVLDGGSRAVTKTLWEKKFKPFKKIRPKSSYLGGDIKENIPSLAFIAECFKQPYFVGLFESQESQLEPGQFLVRLPTREEPIFTAEIKSSADGTVREIDIFIAENKLCISREINAIDLEMLIPELKGIPYQVEEECLDTGESFLYEHLKTDPKSGNDPKSYFSYLVSQQGQDDLEKYLNDF